jgi:hypothetical protein
MLRAIAEALRGSSGVFRVMPAAITRYGMGVECKHVACNREALHGSFGAFRQILVVSIRTPLIFPLIPVCDPDGAI